MPLYILFEELYYIYEKKYFVISIYALCELPHIFLTTVNNLFLVN